MKRLVRIITLTVLASLLAVSVSLSDQDVRIEINDVAETNEKWHSSISPGPLQFKYFEAIVQDSAGKQYAIAASVAGNKYVYEAHAWLADTDQWCEIFGSKAEMKSKGPDVRTKDSELTFTGEMSDGWRIKATRDNAAFDVSSVPERPASRYSVDGKFADFNGYISFRTKVSGKITIDQQEISVEGLGYGIHTFGDMGKHVRWKYVGFRCDKLCITAMNAQFGNKKNMDEEKNKDLLDMFVTVDDNMELNQYSPSGVTWREIDDKTWQISATQDGKQIDMIVHLTKLRPANSKQPYFVFKKLIFKSTTNLSEYLADIQVTVTGPNPGDREEFQFPGTAMDFDLTK